MAHRNARLTVHGRRLLVQRVRGRGHARRPRRQGDGRLAPVRPSLGRPLRRRGRRRPARSQSSRPHRCRRGPAPRSKRRSSPPGSSIAAVRTGSAPSSASPARTVSRILRRHDVPRLCELRPADRRGDPGLEDHRGPLRTRPARRAGPHGRQEDRPHPRRRRLASPRPRRWAPPPPARTARIGFDYVHSVVDDHSRLAYSEILADEKADTCAAFFARAARPTSPPTASPHRTRS